MPTHTAHIFRRSAIAALGLVGICGLAACGSGSSYSAPPTRATTQPAGVTGAPVVGISADTKIGPVLADADGRTVYTLTNNGKSVPCTGTCAAIWPPLLVPAGGAVATAAGVTGIGTTTVAASTQVTSAGQPLYRFSGDDARGATKGDGIVNFGGTWRAVRSNGATAPTPPANAGNYSGGY